MRRPMTPKGYDAMRTELLRLKGMRPSLAKAIEIARGHGDLSENADYHAAKEHSGMVEAKIRDLESKLAVAEVIDPKGILNPTKIVFGVSVRMSELQSGDEKVVQIVGADEADVKSGTISCESPLGRSLIGKENGDLVKVQLPMGVKEFEVLDIFVAE